MRRSSQSSVGDSQLLVEVDGKKAFVRWAKRTSAISLDKQSLLLGIVKVVRDIRKVRGVKIDIKGATFSGTRQVIATVNTLAWAFGVKVNGKKQMSAKYDRGPNITIAKP